MRAIELCPGNRLAGRFLAAPSVPTSVEMNPRGGHAVEAVLRRIDNLTRLKALARRLTAARERDFWHVIDNARLAVAQGAGVDRLAPTILALDLLSLELCDE